MNLRESIRVIPVCMISAAMVLATAGCSGGSGNAAPPAGSTTAITQPLRKTAVPHIAHVADAATRKIMESNIVAGDGSAETGSIAAAHPTALLASDQSGTTFPASMRNQDDIDVAAGAYTLYTQCAGEGTLSIEFTVGSTTQTGTLTCGAGVSSALTRVNLDKDAHGIIVNIVPDDGSKVEVAYRIDHQRL